MIRSLRSFSSDQRGGTTLLFAVSGVVLLGFGAMAVDVGTVQLGTDRPDPALPSDDRFRPGTSASANAVRVEMRAVTLGVGLGQADSWVSGVRCGGAVLVH